MHLLPFSPIPFLPPSPLILSLLATSCLSKGRKKLELSAVTGYYSSFGISETEGEGQNLQPLALILQGGQGKAAVGQQNLLLQETRRGDATEPQLVLLTAAWGWQLNSGLFIYYTTQSTLIFTPSGVSSPLVPWGKDLGFTLQSPRSAAKKYHLFFLGHLLEKPFLGGEEGGRIFLFSSPVYEFFLVLT